MRFSVLILLFVTLLSCQPKHDVPLRIDLDKNWQFKAVHESKWNSATVPGNVHADLLEHKLIAHPFIGTNEDSLQWISETDWEYKTMFSVDKYTYDKKHIELNFEGLDTYASVFLNDTLILETDNSFREFSVDVKRKLKPKNELRIVFERTSISEEKEKAKLNYQLPEGNRIFTRKAQFQYGWDWGPKLNTSGIWRPITLKAWNDFKIKNIYINQATLDKEKAGLIIDLETDSNNENELSYDIYLNDSLNKTLEKLPDFYPSILPLQIENPKLWWPHNLGEPYLYKIKIIVRNGKKILDSISVKKGIRKIELVTDKDSHGNTFHFKVNDVPIFMKGANYIPQNSMQNMVTDSHYEKLLDDVVEANMNMLRVWGGGIYEKDIFYDLCDEKGIIIWQDFMFACAMYPGDKGFLDNATIEAEQQVKRLRNHASIALWCGNNESSEGWHRWGWQANRSEQEKEDIWNNYKQLFKRYLPAVVKNYTNSPYWESSPKYGRGNPKYKSEGDAHDWWIWHDGYPFEHLENNVPRFMSEFGFQSFPSYETIRFINQNDSIDISSEGFKNHQKHSRGFEIIDTYMQRDFPIPTNAEDYVYVSQLLQAHGIVKGIEAHRRAKPYTMGTLYWQLNDCWPAVSWSSIDYFGNWKALHYGAKKAFENIIVSNTLENDMLRTYLINDTRNEVSGNLNIRIIDFDGNEIWQKTEYMSISELSSDLKNKLDVSALNLTKNSVVVISEFDNRISYSYLSKPKELQLKKAPISTNIQKSSNGFEIILSSTTLQKNVFLYTESKGHFSNNYFDLMPNTEVKIEFETAIENLEDLKIKTLNSLL